MILSTIPFSCPLHSTLLYSPPPLPHDTQGMQEHEERVGLISHLFNLPTNIPIKITKITSGITNLLYKCEWLPNGCCLLRVYGKNTETFINRTDEIAVMSYLHSEFNWFPQVYATFSWGIVYGFVSGTSLHHGQLCLPEMAQQIAQFLGCWHRRVKITALQSSSPTHPSLIGGLEQLFQNGKFCINHLMLKKIVPLAYSSSSNATKFDQLVKHLLPISASSSSFHRLLQVLKEEIERRDCLVVFCHNDLLAGNIIWNEKEQQIRFIDFEYATYNYQAYDIANHFCEFAGFTCNWSEIPGEEFQRQWISWYLEEFNGEGGSDELQVDKLLNNVRFFIPYCHLYWSLWALHQAENSVVDFDYISYAAKRLGQIQHLFLE